MVASKRRSASTWAVSRKVEGKEPRNARNRKDDEFRPTEVNTSTAAKGKEVLASSGSETMARVTRRLHGNPGGPAAAFQRLGWRVCQTTAEREEGKISGRESDHLIVPAKAGNAAGGKEMTDGRAK